MSEFIKITETNDGFENWSNQTHISDLLRTNLQKADFLLVPIKHSPSDEFVFPSGTFTLTQYLRKEAQSQNVNFEICIEDKDYKELALHSDLMRIAEIVVTLAIAPIATSMIAAYIYDTLGKRRAQKATVKSKLIIEMDGERKNFEISYDGPADSYERTVIEAIETITLNAGSPPAPEENENNNA